MVIFPGRPDQVAAVRRYIASLLPQDATLDDITLLTSEAITNAVEHTRSGEPGGTVTLTVLDVGHATRVEVIDQGGLTRPEVRDDVRKDSEHGYGLHLVRSLARRWGSRSRGEGTELWFEVGR